MSKRYVVDNGWFDALRRDNVELVTQPIEEIVARGVRTTDAALREFDIIVMASGFRQNDYLWPMHIEGRGGVSVRELWRKDGARAFMGIALPGFPNFYCLYGPNTNNKAGTPCLYDELQLRYALQCIQKVILGEASALDVTREAYDRYNQRLDESLSKSI